jgi:glycosyltransferase involved in cell wall biosynthesis
MLGPNLMLIYRDELSNLPPLMSAAVNLAQAGFNVKVICGSIREDAMSLFARYNICWEVWRQGGRFGNANRSWSRLEKIIDVYAFKRWASRTLKEIPSGTVLWVGSGDTAIYIGSRLYRSKYILQLHELYDEFPLRRYCIGRAARNALEVVVPDDCRAAIARVWFSLQKTPTVIPNRPHLALFDMASGLSLGGEELSGDPGSIKRILYQGHIDEKARDLRCVARAINSLGHPWVFELVGRDFGSLSTLRVLCARVKYHGFMAAPQHLSVTERAYIGLVAYNYTSLNNIFCAPNKIWEYTYFGVPLLCNDVPGLRRIIESHQCGVCVDFDDESAVRDAIQEIHSNYDYYSAKSRVFFLSGDPTRVFESIREKCERGVLGQ